MLKTDHTFNFDINNVQYLAFSDEGKTWFVPFFGFIVKIIDFGYSSIPELGIISTINDDKHYRHYTPESDVLVLFYSIYHSNPNLENILAKFDSKKSFKTAHINQLRNVEFPTCKKLLGNPLFRKYIKKGIPESHIIGRFG